MSGESGGQSSALKRSGTMLQR